VAKNYPVNVALHTDHCPKDKLDGFVRPLLAAVHRAGEGRRAAPLFQSHMWDGSRCRSRRTSPSPTSCSADSAANIILEIEVGRRRW
jgi:fructose-bisphosphate aldolase class II